MGVYEGNILYCAKHMVDYSHDEIKSIHITSEGAEKAIREMAGSTDRGLEGHIERSGVDGLLRISGNYEMWYIETMILKE